MCCCFFQICEKVVCICWNKRKFVSLHEFKYSKWLEVKCNRPQNLCYTNININTQKWKNRINKHCIVLNQNHRASSNGFCWMKRQYSEYWNIFFFFHLARQWCIWLNCKVHKCGRFTVAYFHSKFYNMNSDCI